MLIQLFRGKSVTETIARNHGNEDTANYLDHWKVKVRAKNNLHLFSWKSVVQYLQRQFNIAADHGNEGRLQITLKTRQKGRSIKKVNY